MTIDPRLLEVLAMAICWAEFPDHAERTDDPASYWAAVTNRAGYYRDAETLAKAIGPPFSHAVVPVVASGAMCAAALAQDRGVSAGVGDVWQTMVGAAVRETMFRQPTPLAERGEHLAPEKSS